MELIAKVLTGLFFLAILVVIFCYPTMWLWNWLMPDIFGLKTINEWQALGLLALSSILLKSSK